MMPFVAFMAMALAVGLWSPRLGWRQLTLIVAGATLLAAAYFAFPRLI